MFQYYVYFNVNAFANIWISMNLAILLRQNK